jgi:hypothetical protein
MLMGNDMHFTFPLNELDVGTPKPGDVGEVTIKVEVMSVDKETVSLLKHGPVKVTKPFGEMDLEELRNRIGTVDDNEKPVNDRKEK